MSDSVTAALQSDEDIRVIVSLLDHVIKSRKDLGSGFRRLLVYFIIYYWFLDLKGSTLTQSKEPIHEIGTGSHTMSLSSHDILAYLNRYVHPLHGFTAHLQNGNFFTPGRTVIRRLKDIWEDMSTKVADLKEDDKAKWRALDFIYGSCLPPTRLSDKARNLGSLSYRIIYTVDWRNLLKFYNSTDIVLPTT
jgi:hypothetical protein